MGQIHGSGAGNWNNAASVDSSEGTQQGRLFVNNSGTVQLYDGVTGPALIDDITFAQTVIEYEHHEIHEGNSYVTGSEANVGNGGSIVFLLETPDTSTFSHVFIHSESQTEASRAFCEDVAVSASGTELVSYNRDRTSLNTAGMKVFYQPTVSSTGSCLQHVHWGTAKKAGAEQRSENEWILNSGTGYSVVLLNETTSENVINTWINWYEHMSNS